MNAATRTALQTVINAAWYVGRALMRPSTALAAATRVVVRHPQRAYKGASGGRLVSTWARVPTTSDAEIRVALAPLRARSREMWRNHAYMRRFSGLLRSNVIGPNGIVYQARVRARDGTLARDVNDALEQHWRQWGEMCDANGELDWLDVQNLVIDTLAQDGEVLIELRNDADNPYGSSLRLHDPELLDVNHNVDRTRAGGRISMGVQYDANGKREGYWLRGVDAHGNYTVRRDGQPYRWVPAGNMLHLFVRDRIGQSRGVPWCHAIMWKAHQQDGYEDAAVTAARIGASKMGFLRRPGGDPYQGDETGENEQPIIDAAEPGIFADLPEGYEFVEFNPDYPHAQFGTFSKHMLRGQAVGLNVSYEALSGDLEGVNYSSIRAGVLEDREIWKAIQGVVVRKLCTAVHRFWILAALARGALTVMGQALGVAQAAELARAMWQGRRWAWADPQKDMAAHASAYALGATSISTIIRELGKDPEEVWRERQAEEALMAQYGVEPNLPGGLAPLAGAGAGDTDEGIMSDG